MPASKARRFRVPGFSQRELSVILKKVHEGQRPSLIRFNVLLNGLFDELLTRQASGPLEICDRDLRRIAAGFGFVVRENAGKLANELCEADAGRGRLSDNRMNELKEAVQGYIEEMTSAVSAGDLLENEVLQRFTISNARRARRDLARRLSRAGFRRLLFKEAADAFLYVRTKFDLAKSSPDKRTGSETPLPPKTSDLSHHFDSALLTDRQREVLSLRWEREMKVSAIARWLGLHRKTVQECLARGAVKLERAKQTESSARRHAISRPGNLE